MVDKTGNHVSEGDKVICSPFGNNIVKTGLIAHIDEEDGYAHILAHEDMGMVYLCDSKSILRIRDYTKNYKDVWELSTVKI